MGVEFLHVNGLNKEKSLKVFVSKTEKQTIFNERICWEKIITIYNHKAYFYQTAIVAQVSDWAPGPFVYILGLFSLSCSRLNILICLLL